ncbi:hypothetical protein L873DRAFT_1685869, partial [Choiromyces venosus 120613-1]
IVEFLSIEGYPMEADPDYKESNINHPVYAAISPIFSDFIRKTGCVTMQLRNEKEILSADGEIAGTKEFAIVDLISVRDEIYILTVKAKSSPRPVIPSGQSVQLWVRLDSPSLFPGWPGRTVGKRLFKTKVGPSLGRLQALYMADTL